VDVVVEVGAVVVVGSIVVVLDVVVVIGDCVEVVGAVVVVGGRVIVVEVLVEHPSELAIAGKGLADRRIAVAIVIHVAETHREDQSRRIPFLRSRILIACKVIRRFQELRGLVVARLFLDAGQSQKGYAKRRESQNDSIPHKSPVMPRENQ